jgi:hypothetical protein
MKQRVIFELPMYMVLPRKTKADKKISLTMNWHLNAYHHERNRVKKDFRPISGERFTAKKIRLSYRMTVNDTRKTDLLNWVATIDKFFLDWLVAEKMIPDDTLDHAIKYRIDWQRDPMVKHYRMFCAVDIFE